MCCPSAVLIILCTITSVVQNSASACISQGQRAGFWSRPPPLHIPSDWSVSQQHAEDFTRIHDFFFFSLDISLNLDVLSSWRQVAASGQSPGLWLTGTNYCSSFYHFYLSILTFYCFPLFFFLFLFLLLFPSSIFFSSPFFLLFFFSFPLHHQNVIFKT